MNYHAAAGGANTGGGDPYGGVDTISPGDPGGLTPGSTFDASEVDRCGTTPSSGGTMKRGGGGPLSAVNSLSSGERQQLIALLQEQQKQQQQQQQHQSERWFSMSA